MKNEFHGRRNRWGGFKGRVLITLVLAFSMIIAAPFFNAAAYEKFDPTPNNCSLTVKVPTSEEFESLVNKGLEIDLYQLAGVQANKGSDGFVFEWNSPYKGLEEFYKGLQSSVDSEISSDDLNAANASVLHDLSQEAAKMALGLSDYNKQDPIKEKKIVKAAGSIDGSVSGLNAGLYLLVVRGANTTTDNTKAYVTTTKDDSGERITVSKAYGYNFLPQLVTLPTREPGEGDGLNEDDGNRLASTADTGDWVYNVTVNLKGEKGNGSLRIVKNLDRYYENGGTVVFTFLVEAWTNLDENGEPIGEPEYSETRSLAFDGSEMRKSITLVEKIPVGARVIVTEIYDGQHYKVISDSVVGDGNPAGDIIIITDDLDNPVTAEFTNDYDDTQIDGHSVINRFTYKEDIDDWVWESVPAVPEVQEGE